MAAQLHVILTQALDANAKPISGAKWKFYVAGTTTPQAVYEDADLENSLGAVVTADSAGIFPPMFYDAARSYRGILCDAAGSPLPDRDFDPINGGQVADLGSTESGKGAGMVAFSHDATYGVGTVGKRLQQVITPQDHPFLAVGDYTTDDTGALTAWINALNDIADQSPGPIGAFIPTGRYRYTAALPNITNSVTIFSDNVRQAILSPVGNFDALTFKGPTRIASPGLANIRIDGSGQTGGFGLVVDWAQDFRADDILISDGWNGVSLRQCGEPRISGRLDKLRGTIGLIMQGLSSSSTARNGTSDTIQTPVIDLTIEGVDFSAAATLDACVIDGFVHTIDFELLRMLNCKSGLTVKNSAGLAQKYAPSLISGWIETENVYEYGQDWQWANDVSLSEPFVSTSATHGIRVGANVDRWIAQSPVSRSNSGHGMQVLAGAKDVALYDPLLVLNGASATGIQDVSGNVRIYGGRIGGGRDGVPETQSVGVQGLGATPTRVTGANLTGNVGNAFGGNVLAADCAGVSYTVSTLPTGALTGARAYVTDANSTTFNATVAGGGSNKVPVIYDGAAWRIG